MIPADDTIGFKSEADDRAGGSEMAWKILIADDDAGVHHAVELALADASVDGRPLRLYHAYDGREACRIVGEQLDMAVILMDLAMEEQGAGLEAVRAIRQSLGNHRVRIVVCTGNLAPMAHAPDLEVSECWPKRALTSGTLHGIVRTAIGGYVKATRLRP